MPPRTPSPTPPPTDDSDLSDYSSRSSSPSDSPLASIRSKSASPECLATARDMSISPYPDPGDHDGIRSPSPYSDRLSLSTASPDKADLEQGYRRESLHEKRSPDTIQHKGIKTPPSYDSSGVKSASLSRNGTKSPASSDHPVGNKPESSSNGDSGRSSPTSRPLSSRRRRHKSSSRSRSRSVSLSLGALVKSQQKRRRSASRSRSRSQSRTRYVRRRREITRSRSRSKSRRRYSAERGRRSRRSRSHSKTYSSTSSSRSRSPMTRGYTERRRSPPRGERHRNSDRVDQSPPNPSRCLALFGLSFKTTERQLWNLFAPFGEVKHVRLMTDRYTGESRGFAFIYYTSIADAAAGVKAMNGQYVDGARLRVDFSMTIRPIERLQSPSRRSRSRERHRDGIRDRQRSYSRERHRSPSRERNRDRRRSRSASRRRHRPILKEEY